MTTEITIQEAVTEILAAHWTNTKGTGLYFPRDFPGADENSKINISQSEYTIFASPNGRFTFWDEGGLEQQFKLVRCHKVGS